MNAYHLEYVFLLLYIEGLKSDVVLITFSINRTLVRPTLLHDLGRLFQNISDNKLGSQGARLLGHLMKDNVRITTLIASRKYCWKAVL